ncbi:hypothetical protein GGR50DRAFT_652233 [Xylaria sp. CBS 124048]|nr:hypothetical protein GGR50DRAFT_652233 [Xylaria sp. CBS 124048]
MNPTREKRDRESEREKRRNGETTEKSSRKNRRCYDFPPPQDDEVSQGRLLFWGFLFYTCLCYFPGGPHFWTRSCRRIFFLFTEILMTATRYMEEVPGPGQRFDYHFPVTGRKRVSFLGPDSVFPKRISRCPPPSATRQTHTEAFRFGPLCAAQAVLPLYPSPPSWIDFGRLH